MTIRQIVLAALTAALSAGSSAGAQAVDDKSRGRRHERAKAGQHACAGPSAIDRTPDEWAYGAKGVR
jgi:uncharacterized membrane protein